VINSTVRKLDFSKRPSWARVVSDVVSPPVVWAVLALPVALQYSQSTQNAVFWALLYGFFICLLPIIYVAYNVKRGNITDLHMKERRQRFRPLLVSLLSTAIVWWLLKFLGAPRAFPLLAMLSLIQIGVIALITLVWQVSMHMMSIAGAVVAVGILFSTGPAFIVLPLVPLVAAARLNLHRHTPAQVIAGTVIGSVVPVMVLSLMPLSILQGL
jgi:hypothetical protein